MLKNEMDRKFYIARFTFGEEEEGILGDRRKRVCINERRKEGGLKCGYSR